jgi:hypothetical protein
MDRSQLIEELAHVVRAHPTVEGGELFGAFRAAVRTARPATTRRPPVSAPTWDAAPPALKRGEQDLSELAPSYDGPTTLDESPQSVPRDLGSPLRLDGPSSWDGPPAAPSTASAKEATFRAGSPALRDPLGVDGPSTLDGPPQPPSTASMARPTDPAEEQRPPAARGTDRTLLVRGIICAPRGSIYHRRDLPNVRIPVAAAQKAGEWRVALRCETRAHHAALSHFIGRTGLFLRLDRFLGEGTPVKLSVKMTAAGDCIHLRGVVGVESDAGTAMAVSPISHEFAARWNAASVAIALRDAEASSSGSRVGSRGY